MWRPMAHWRLHGMGWRDFQQRCSLTWSDCILRFHWPLCRAYSRVDQSTNKEATWGVITVIWKREDGGLGRHPIGAGELWANKWLQSTGVCTSRHTMLSFCAFDFTFIISFWTGLHQLPQQINLSHSAAFFPKPLSFKKKKKISFSLCKCQRRGDVWVETSGVSKISAGGWRKRIQAKATTACSRQSHRLEEVGTWGTRNCSLFPECPHVHWYCCKIWCPALTL